MNRQDKFDGLAERNESVLTGNAKAIAKHHDAGKLTARERIDQLLDTGSFQKRIVFDVMTVVTLEWIKRPLGDSVVTGFGTIDGRLVYVFAHDFTVVGGSVQSSCSKGLQGHGSGCTKRCTDHWVE